MHEDASRPLAISQPAADAIPADDARAAAALAAGAGRRLMELRARAAADATGSLAATLGRDGDALAHGWIAGMLREARPADALLSEETEASVRDAEQARRLGAARVWIVDPLDGTREFAERRADGAWRDDFAVHVALWTRDRGLAAGAVALPARDLVLDTASPPAPPGDADAVLGGRRPLRLAVSRTRPPDMAAALGRRPGVELVPMGSTGAKVAAVILGDADAYLHAGGQYEWDNAAPVAVARAAGLAATRLDGSPVPYNQPDPWSPDLLVCHPALLAHLRRLLAEAAPDAIPGESP